jgi:DNA invertase Pin-like site-specific DNA recombinase
MERLQESKAGFRSLTEAVDTTTPAGRMMMQMVGAFAEFERAMLKQRTKAGLDAARPTAQAKASTATGNREARKKGEEDRSRCSPPVRRPSGSYSSGPKSSPYRFHCSPNPILKSLAYDLGKILR